MSDAASGIAAPAAAAPAAKPRGGKMLFVSRLPYSITTDLLNEYFGDVGPLRKAFVVTDKETKQSKGVAYVQYALADDADRAIETLGNKPIPGTDGHPRPIRIEYARSTREAGATPTLGAKRPADVQADRISTKKPKPEHTPQPVRHQPKVQVKKEEEDQEEPQPNKVVPPLGPEPSTSNWSSTAATAAQENNRALAQRTLILTGLARCSPLSDTKQLYKRVRKLGDVEHVHYPAPGENNNAAHVIFRTPNHAHLAVPKLDGHVYKGATLKAGLKARLDARRRLDKAITNPETRIRRDEAARTVAEHSVLQTIVRLCLPHSSVRLPGQPPVDGMELLSHAEGGALANGRIEPNNRLIIRNLPFDITAEDLKAYFLPFGPLYQVDVPQTEKAVREHKHPRRTKAPEASTTVKEEDGSETGEDNEDEDGQSDEDYEKENKSDDQEADESEEESDSESDSETEEDNDEQSKTESQPEESSKPVQVKTESDDEFVPFAVPSEPITATKEDPSQKTETDTKPQTRGRGFAFVWFVSLAEAERAVEGMNGQMVQHGQAERIALQAAKNSGLGVVRRKAKKLRDAVLEHAHEARKVTVAFALAKDQYEKTRGAATDPAAEASDDSDDDEQDSDEGSGEQHKSRPPPPEEGTTVFVRNIPFSANETEFAALFRHFGPMRYARLVRGSDQQPRGTGFVSFWDKDHADAVLALAKRIAAEADANAEAQSATDKGKDKGKDKHFSSVLTADAASALTAPLTLQGRVLAVIPAMERSDAAAIAADRVAARAKTDRRNTYLLREGVPFAHAPLASIVGEKDADIRRNSFGIRKQQLASNPALYVSPTRLSVRRLPLWVSDVELRKLINHALKAFDDEVKAGTRDGLAPAEQNATGYDPGATGAKPAKVTARVIRQKDRLDTLFGLRGTGRSQGYGFVEVRSLPDALKVLRWLNAHPDALKLLAGFHRAELEGARKHLKAELKHSVENTPEGRDKRADSEALHQRIETRLAEIGDSPERFARSERGGRLLVEFALENATITRRKKERTLQLQGGNARKRAQEADGGRNANTVEMGSGRWHGRDNDDDDARRSSKRSLYERKANLKIAADKKARGPGANSSASGSASATPAKGAAAIISRKRRERKAKRGKA